MASWNLIICSDIQPTPVVIHCPDSTKWTVIQLRSEAGKKLGYPEEDLMLYCNETVRQYYQKVNYSLSVKG